MITAKDRYNILSRIVAQKGTDQVDLYAELGKAESLINNIQNERINSQINPPVTAPEAPQAPIAPEAGQSMGKYDNL